MQDTGGAETALFGMLRTSAVAMFFSCSGATRLSSSEFDCVGSVVVSVDCLTLLGFSVGRAKLANVTTILLPS
jgi:hypothetical protein